MNIQSPFLPLDVVHLCRAATSKVAQFWTQPTEHTKTTEKGHLMQPQPWRSTPRGGEHCHESWVVTNILAYIMAVYMANIHQEQHSIRNMQVVSSIRVQSTCSTEPQIQFRLFSLSGIRLLIIFCKSIAPQDVPKSLNNLITLGYN